MPLEYQNGSGHAIRCVFDAYVENAQLIEEAFYAGHGADSAPSRQKLDKVSEQADAAGMDPEMLVKILGNPEMVNLLKSLSKTMGM